MFKKSVCFILAVILLISVFGLSGCNKDKSSIESGKTDAAVEKNKSDAPEKVTLRVLTRWSGDTPRENIFRERLKEFEKQNPGVTVQDESIADEASFNNKFKTAVATGEPPEIWQNYGGESFKEYVSNEVVLNLQPYMDKDKEWSGKFLPLFGDWQYSDIKGTYGIPMEFYSVAIFYNKDLFKKINAEPPKTIEDFEQLADKFKAINVIPMAMGDKDNFRGGHLLSYLTFKKSGFQLGKDLIERNKKWDCPEMLELMQIMKKWQDLGIFGPNMVTTDNNMTKEKFFREESAMIFDGSWAISDYSNSPIKDKVSAMPFPYFKDKPEFKDFWFGGAGGYSVSNIGSDAKKDAAVKLLKYICSADVHKLYQTADKGGIFPTKIESDPNAVSPLTIEYSKLLEGATDIKTEIEQYDRLPQLIDKARNEIQGMFAGNSPAAALKAIQEEVDSAK